MNISVLENIKESSEVLEFKEFKISVKKYIAEAHKLYIANYIKDIIFGEKLFASDDMNEDVPNHVVKNSLFVMNVIKFYTDIIIDSDNYFTICDSIVESGLYDKILDIIPSFEFKALETMVNDVINEEQRKIDKENSFENYLKSFLNNLSEKLPSEDTIKQTMNDLPKMINDANPDNLKFIADAVAFNNGIKPNRQQRRKSEKKGDVNV